jgi:spermidine synthase
MEERIQMIKPRPQRLPKPAKPPKLPEVQFSDDGPLRYLHLDSPWIQGAMHMAKPYHLELEYIQRMMAWLLFIEPDQVPGLHAMQLGLGAASLTKSCRKTLGMRTTAVELNERVIHACRIWFKLPADDSLLTVLQADAGHEIAQPRWHNQVDALQVDLYDEDAACPVINTTEFYAHCKAALTDQGCMTVNLFGTKQRNPQSLDLIAQVFGVDAVWVFQPTKDGNTVVLAQRQSSGLPLDNWQAILQPIWQARAEVIESQWGLPAKQWLRALRPMKGL